MRYPRLCVGIGVVALTVAANSWSAERRFAVAVEYETHDGYYVVNKFEPNEPASFVVIQDQDTFDKIFGVAMVMNDKSKRLPHEAFKTKIVLTAIKRGQAVWEYEVASVSNDRSVLRLRYTSTEKKSDSATFTCPLIVSAPKGKYTAVAFMENGEAVKTVTLPAPKKTPSK